MLSHLQIHNIALIDEVNIEFGEGLNVLTGETGAGKSIIIDSINSLLGERLSRELIRSGKEKATVEAVFHVDNERLLDIFEALAIEPEEDGTLIISREFTLAGKNICRINGKMATVSMLKEVGQRIIDMHGQHDNQSLLRTESHIDLLDSFGGHSIAHLKQDYSELLAKYRTIKNKIRSLSGDKKERERKLDLLKFQIDEIKKAKLKSNEEEDLNKQRLVLASAEKIIESLSNAYELLSSGNNIKNSASDNINETLQGLNQILKLDEKYEDMHKRLQDVSYLLEDIIEDIRRERDSVEYNPGLLEEIEERLDLIYKLKKKYGSTVGEVLDYCRSIENELEEIVKSEEIVNELQAELDKLNSELLKTAQAINAERRKAAEILENRIGEELDDLEMKRSKFKVNIEFDDSTDENGDKKYLHTGLDRVEFLISPNVGEPLKPLAKIASGGEMSRIMLAIKMILANVDSIPVLIFDEIDTGISGKAAQKVGEKLSFLSKGHQVVCVTHLAQIGCMADNHYLIEKVSDEQSTQTSVKHLDGEEVKKEIARIISGTSISDITLKHAEEMLSNARKFKMTV